jgi:ribose transport system permease protein
MNVNLIKISLFVVTGVLAGLAGVITASRLMTSVPTAGAGVELRVITACVIGGASLMGGEGTVIGGLLGVLLMAVVTNGMTLINFSPYWHGTVIGMILILAVMFDYWTRQRRVEK